MDADRIADLSARLRAIHSPADVPTSILHEAADALDVLTAECERLKCEKQDEHNDWMEYQRLACEIRDGIEAERDEARARIVLLEGLLVRAVETEEMSAEEPQLLADIAAALGWAE